MAITALQIKELRARTGAGVMDCKKALGESGGDLDAAVETLRKKGIATAEKKAGRIAAEGVIAFAGSADAEAGVLVEINCETDFVAKDADFNVYAGQVAEAILAARPNDLGDLDDLGAVADLAVDGGGTVESARRELIARVGENISVRRFAVSAAAAGGVVGAYLHGTRIGVLVELGGSADSRLARDVAMHIAASRPLCIGEQDMPAQVLEKERAIFTAQAEESGKPANIAQKIVEGRIRKFLAENTLLGQPFVKNPEQSVGELLAAAGATVEGMERFEVGEGLEKRDDDFVAEVMAQAGQTD